MGASVTVRAMTIYWLLALVLVGAAGDLRNRKRRIRPRRAALRFPDYRLVGDATPLIARQRTVERSRRDGQSIPSWNARPIVLKVAATRVSV
jgi:hypothetical protein